MKQSKPNKSDKPLRTSTITNDEYPYVVPHNWLWAKIVDLSEVIRGVSYKKDEVTSSPKEGYCLILRGGNIQSGKIVSADDVYVPNNFVSDRQLLRRGDIVVVASSGSKDLVGKAAMIAQDEQDVSFGAFLSLVRPGNNINPNYFGLYFQTKFYRQSISDLSAGININNIKREHLELLKIPIPPLPEQKRIVAKVESLLNKINQAKQLIAEAKETFSDRRTAILAKAFRGDFTKKWREENSQIRASEKLSNLSFLNDSLLVNAPISVYPSSWVRTNLGVVCNKITDGTHDTPKPVNSGIPYITAQNIRDRNIDFENALCLPGEIHKTIFSRCNPEKGDVVLVNIGAGTATPALVKVDFEFSMKNIALLKPNKKYLDGQFFEYFMLYIKPLIFQQISRGGTQPFLSLKLISSIPIIIPPLLEQEIIVKKIDSLLEVEERAIKYCDNITPLINSLVTSIMSRSFRGELGTNDPSEESAIELLKEVIAEKTKE